MANFFLYVTLLMAFGIPVISIIAELSSKTPNSIVYSIIRSLICLGCILFLSNVMSPTYKASFLHVLSIGFIFFVSCLEFYMETHDVKFMTFISDTDQVNHNDNIN